MKLQLPVRLPLMVDGPYERGVKASYMPYIGYHPLELTVQEEKFVHYVVSGMTPQAAGTAVGASDDTVRRLMNMKKIQDAIDFFIDKARADLNFNIESAHKMFLDAYEMARVKEDPTAMKMCAEALTKLHGIGADFDLKRAKLAKDQDKDPDNMKRINSRRQAERVPDSALLQAAGVNPDYLEPRRDDPQVIEAKATVK